MADPPSDHFSAPWDWDNLLDFSTADDVFPWASEGFDPPLSQKQHNSASADRDSGGTGGGASSKVRKRDPRLVCENFLAGRVPCACPEMEENDEEEEEMSKKRNKVQSVRCQVPSCQADITHLKGYHRRHRVCLSCANAPTVTLGNVLQRYCQQCGKFHVLPDFDEGKRSCRRKLERHNNRRRRKPMNSIQQHVPELDTRLPNASSEIQNETNNGQESKSFSSLGTSEKQTSSGSGEQHEDITSMVNTETVSAHTNIVSSSYRTDIASSSYNKGKVHPEYETSGRINAPCQSTEVMGSGQQMPSNVLVEPQLEHDDVIGIEYNRHYLTDLLEEDYSHKEAFPNRMKDGIQREDDIDLSKSSISSSRHDKNFSYVSVCPTRRVSFKLYDWNPAEFPRRLRQQILHWLASMPVELESYIRPGCTILTTFIALPWCTWDKIIGDAIGHVHGLLNASQSILSNKGRMHIYLNNIILKSENGKTLLLDKKNCQLLPKLYYVYPFFIEAGHSIEIFAYGKNLLHSKFRFLLSFGENYLHYNSCKVILIGKGNSCFGSKQGKLEVSDLEIFKIFIPSIDSSLIGPAFIEVENEFGTSNFIPILIGDKEICSEFQLHEQKFFGTDSCCVSGCELVCKSSVCEQKMARRQCFSELLLDIAWVLKNPNSDENCMALSSSQIRRLNCLFGYLLNAQLFSVTEKVLFSEKVIQVLKDVFQNSNYLKDGDRRLLQNYSRLAWESLQNKFKYSPQKDFAWFVHNVVHKGLLVIPREPRCSQIACDNVKPFEGLNDTYVSETELEIHTDMLMPLLQKEKPNSTSISSKHFSCLFSNQNIHLTGNLKGNHRFLIIAISVIAICAGICTAFQHPHQVREISMSIRRCLFRSP
eukprot:TRINITY_DN15905_c0_g1_i1.p1 TRINITY_DN15905_c0_g1~~TRINITY_DN15905_c0_g1_i1.p1  ORF type:complete len:875 (-),score=133.42 TRINITY_DN15905_c0_g1_i1:322-2946(-)